MVISRRRRRSSSIGACAYSSDPPGRRSTADRHDVDRTRDATISSGPVANSDRRGVLNRNPACAGSEAWRNLVANALTTLVLELLNHFLIESEVVAAITSRCVRDSSGRESAVAELQTGGPLRRSSSDHRDARVAGEGVSRMAIVVVERPSPRAEITVRWMTSSDRRCRSCCAPIQCLAGLAQTLLDLTRTVPWPTLKRSITGVASMIG